MARRAARRRSGALVLLAVAVGVEVEHHQRPVGAGAGDRLERGDLLGRRVNGHR
jgi:hypothetical protein